MTIMAGVIGFRNTPPPGEIVAALREGLSRDPRDVRVEHLSATAYIAKVDLGAWGAPAFSVAADGSVAALVGEPLLVSSDEDRARHLSRLHAAWDRDDWSDLDRARGTYCAVHWCESRRILSLIGDKLGARPLYYCIIDASVVFATALRILEALPGFQKTMDVRGVTELLCFGAPLGRRTPYANISVLHSGETVTVRDGTIERTRYWRWDRPVRDSAGEPSLRRLYDQFLEATRARLRGDGSALALLSGGLDSRCVVGALRALGTDVTTLNFYRFPERQDRVLAAQVAEALGTRHHAFALKHDQRVPHPTKQMLADIAQQDGSVQDRPSVVWTGDGGSVGVGLVYFDTDMLSLAREGRWSDVVDLFLLRHGSRPLARMFQRHLAPDLQRVPYEGVAEELARLERAELGRRFHLVLMVNDQRRHLASFYEDIDLHRLELLIPFFDAEFLEAALSTSLQDGLRHHMYHRWLGEFPAAVSSVPWQTYPRHEACPLPVPPALSSQWDPRLTKQLLAARRPSQLSTLRRVRRSSDFPAPILRRSVLGYYELAYRFGLSDYGYVATAADIYHRYWRASEGRYTMSPVEETS